MNKVISPKYFLTLFLIISVGFNVFSQSVKAESEKAESEIQQLMKQLEVVGLSVAVVKKGDIIYKHSFGLKDIENNKPLTDKDIFRIASISKSFSATAIMQLVAAGKLSLDDDMSKLVGFKIRNPKFPETVITLKMAMSHRSSLNDSEGYMNLDVINPDKNPNWAKGYSDYEPGTGYKYCNLNYNLTGTIIEKTSGERFDEYIKRHILNPLNLNAGYCVDALDSNLFTTLYEYNATTKAFIASPAAYAPRREEIKNYVFGYSTPIFSPTGGMKISAGDLATYMTMHMDFGKYKGQKIISKKHSKIMQTTLSDDENYGLGLRKVDSLIPGKIMTGHFGNAYGLYSAMFFHPEDKFGFVVITNGYNSGSTADVNDVLKQTMNVLYTNFVK